MEEEKKRTFDVISSFLKRGIKKHEARADTTRSTTTNSCKDKEKWIFLQENQIDERRANVQKISTFLIVVGLVLLYVNYFGVLHVIIGKECGTIITRIINLGAAFVIIVTGLIMLDNTKYVEY